MRVFALLLVFFCFHAGTQEQALEALGISDFTKKQVAEKNKNKPVGALCSSPRAALQSFLQGDGLDQINCFEPGDRNPKELLEQAKKLKYVLESQGIILKIQDIPEEPNYKNSFGNKRFKIPQLSPEVFIIFTKNGWYFPAAVIDSVDILYSQTKKIDLGVLYNFVPDWAGIDVLGINGLNITQIALLFLFILMGLIIRSLIGFLVARQVGGALSRFGMHHFNEILKKAALPIGNLAMAGFLAMLIPSLDLNIYITRYLMIAIRIGAALSSVLLAYRSVDVLAQFMMQRALLTDSKLDDQLVPLFRRGMKITVSIVGGIFILQNLDVDVTSLLAGVTIGGLAFSFAARDTVANLFGSVTIFADKPFSVGDWVKSAGVEGIVEKVGFRSTRIRTFYNSLVSVPNAKFTDSVVDNLGARQYRRCYAELGVAYNTRPDQIEAFCNGIRAILKSHPNIRQDYFEIHFCGFGDFSLKILLYFFMKVPGWSEELRVRHEIYLDILRLAEKMNVKFAFPTQTLHIETLAAHKEIKPSSMPTTQDLTNAAEYFAPGGMGVVPPGPRVGKPYLAKD